MEANKIAHTAADSRLSTKNFVAFMRVMPMASGSAMRRPHRKRMPNTTSVWCRSARWTATRTLSCSRGNRANSPRGVAAAEMKEELIAADGGDERGGDDAAPVEIPAMGEVAA